MDAGGSFLYVLERWGGEDEGRLRLLVVPFSIQAALHNGGPFVPSRMTRRQGAGERVVSVPQ